MNKTRITGPLEPPEVRVFLSLLFLIDRPVPDRSNPCTPVNRRAGAAIRRSLTR